MLSIRALPNDTRMESDGPRAIITISAPSIIRWSIRTWQMYQMRRVLSGMGIGCLYKTIESITRPQLWHFVSCNMIAKGYRTHSPAKRGKYRAKRKVHFIQEFFGFLKGKMSRVCPSNSSETYDQMKSTSRSKVIKSSLHTVETHHSKHLRRIDLPNKKRDSRACTVKSVYPRTRAINKELTRTHVEIKSQARNRHENSTLCHHPPRQM